MPKLSVVIPVLNQVDLAKATYKETRDNVDQTFDEVEFVIIDNGSDEPLNELDFEGAKIIRLEESVGVYPTFELGMKEAQGEYVAFFHSDLVVWEKGWNNRVVEAFEKNPLLGMIGYIGSNEIDGSGGRGLGTTSNFQGRALEAETAEGIKGWVGSAAAIHGKVSDGLSKAAVVDGCAMILRRKAYETIEFRRDFPIHHFYDRLISTQLLQKYWEIAVLGIACDHFSGYTTAHEKKYHECAEKWSRVHIPEERWERDGIGNINWDATIYREAERIWLGEYRDEIHFVPVRVV